MFEDSYSRGQITSQSVQPPPFLWEACLSLAVGCCDRERVSHEPEGKGLAGGQDKDLLGLEAPSAPPEPQLPAVFGM